MIRLLLLTLLTALLISCSLNKPKLAMTEDEIYREFDKRLTIEEKNLVEIPFIVPDSLINMLRNETTYMSTTQKLDHIMYTLVNNNRLDLQYRDNCTYTASELITEKYGNCIALSHLMIGITRKLNIPSHYVYILRNPTFSIFNNTISFHYHVLVGIEDGTERRYYDFQPGYNKHFLSLYGVNDLEGIALHYNNLGAEFIKDGNNSDARIYMSIAHKLAPKNPEILSNYGLLYSRMGQNSIARTYYQKALEIDETCIPAWHNMLYLTIKENDNQRFQKIWKDLRNINSPTIKILLANMAYREGEYENALNHLDRVNPEMTKLFIVYLLRAQAYYKLGEFEYANKYLQQFEKIEPDNLQAAFLRSELNKQ